MPSRVCLTRRSASSGIDMPSFRCQHELAHEGREVAGRGAGQIGQHGKVLLLDLYGLADGMKEAGNKPPVFRGSIIPENEKSHALQLLRGHAGKGAGQAGHGRGSAIFPETHLRPQRRLACWELSRYASSLSTSLTSSGRTQMKMTSESSATSRLLAGTDVWSISQALHLFRCPVAGQDLLRLDGPVSTNFLTSMLPRWPVPMNPKVVILYFSASA